MKRALTLLLSFIMVTAQAATNNAASAAAADVQAAINLSAPGDTVIVPAGSATWSVMVTVTNPISIFGAGTNSPNTTIISTLNPALLIKPGGAGFTRLSGFIFNGAGGASFGNVQLTGVGIRCDSCYFSGFALFSLHCLDFYGVVDHCIFNETDAGIYIEHPSMGGQNYGDGSWTNADNFGTTNCAVIEDCFFIGAGQNGAIDGCNGGRWTFRHNYVTNDILVAHGTDSTGRPRGTRAVEIYQNQFGNNVGSWGGVMESRSGTLVMWSNTCVGYAYYVNLREYRATNSFGCYGPGGGYPPWGWCINGTNLFDGNTDTNGYPALDQPGRGAGTLLSGGKRNCPTDTDGMAE